MIEPTETESRSRLDDLVKIFKRIKEEAEKEPATVKSAPTRMTVKRLDQVLAARNPVLTVKALKKGGEK